MTASTSPENFHILKMKTHFEKKQHILKMKAHSETHFENENMFFSLSCQLVKINAPSERISAYCDLCHQVDDDPHHH